MLEEIIEDPNKWKYITYSWVGRHIKIPADFFAEINS